MSQTITYKTKYKSLNAIKKVIDKLAGQGSFGAGAVVHAKGEPGFNPGLFNPGPDYDIIFVVRGAQNSEFFKEGFYEKGFAIAINKKTKEISIVYDYRSSSRGPATEATRKKLEQMIEAGEMLNKVVENLKDKMQGMKVQQNSETEWVVEGEFTEEQLKNFLATRPK